MPAYEFEEEIYSFQIDFSRHVNNSVYIQWLEKARVKLCAAAGYPLHRMAEIGVLPVLTDTEISYKKPLVMGDTAVVSVWVEEIGGASAWMGYEIRNQAGELCAKARQRGLWFDAENNRPRRIDEDMKRAMSVFLKD